MAVVVVGLLVLVVVVYVVSLGLRFEAIFVVVAGTLEMLERSSCDLLVIVEGPVSLLTMRSVGLFPGSGFGIHHALYVIQVVLFVVSVVLLVSGSCFLLGVILCGLCLSWKCWYTVAAMRIREIAMALLII